MKLRDLLYNVDTTGHAHCVDMERVAQEFDVNFWGWDDSERMKAYAIKQWLCTDTWVGYYALHLDGELVGLSAQTARKDSTRYYWLNDECAEQVKQYCVSLLKYDDDRYTLLTKEDFEEDWGEMFQLHYSSQILRDTLWYKDTECKVIERHRYIKEVDFDSTEVKIEYNGETIVVPMQDVYFPYKLKGGDNEAK